MDHVHKIENKQGNHSLKNIDFIYLINLDQRPLKLAASLKQLAPYDIHPYRFSAVNGWELPLQAINDIGVKYNTSMAHDLMSSSYLPADHGEAHREIMHVIGRTYYADGMSRGAIGF